MCWNRAYGLPSIYKQFKDTECFHVILTVEEKLSIPIGKKQLAVELIVTDSISCDEQWTRKANFRSDR